MGRGHLLGSILLWAQHLAAVISFLEPHIKPACKVKKVRLREFKTPALGHTARERIGQGFEFRIEGLCSGHCALLPSHELSFGAVCGAI